MSAGWIVLICIVLFFAFLCWFPIRICIAHSDDGFVLRIKLLFWTLPILPKAEKELTEAEKKKKELKEQRKAEKKAAREAKKKEQAAQKPSAAKQQKKKWTLKEILHLAGMIAKSAGRLARRFWKGFVIDKLTLHMAVAGSDAAETGIAYGQMNAKVYTAYSFAEQYVTLKNTDIRIVPDFLSEKSRMEISCELFFRVGTVIASVLAALWCFIKLYFKDKNAAANAAEQQEKQEKAAASQ